MFKGISLKEILVKSTLSILPSKLMNRLAGNYFPIFMLHRFVDSQGNLNTIKVELLKKCLHYIKKNNYKVIALEELFSLLKDNQPIPENCVAFTADDGFYDQFEIIAPIFSEFDMPLTVFVITDLIDGKLWPWDDHVDYVLSNTSKKNFHFLLPDSSSYSITCETKNLISNRRRLIEKLKKMNQTHIYEWLASFYSAAEVNMVDSIPNCFKGGTWGQLKKFVDEGHSVAAHTKTHRVLSRLSEQEVRDEIVGSFEYLKSKIPNCSRVFAYPSGRVSDFGEREEGIISTSPLLGAVSAIPDSVRPRMPLSAIPRFSFPEKFSDFLQYLTYIEEIKSKLRSKF